MEKGRKKLPFGQITSSTEDDHGERLQMRCLNATAIVYHHCVPERSKAAFTDFNLVCFIIPEAYGTEEHSVRK
jgi:hypothetical protein